MAIEVTTLQLDARLTNAEQTISQLQRIKTEGAGAETSFGNLALRIAGFTSLANLAVDVGRKVVSGLVDMAKESVVLAAGFEKARMTWGVLVGDMGKGSKVFADIYAFASKTPLSFEGLNQAATTIKGFGVATEDIIPTLSKLGDVAMGDNNKLQSLALVYGQVMAQGKAKTQDLYQFINAGVPIFNLLAQSMNKSAGEIKTLASEGAVTFEEIEKAITMATSAGGQFFGMMEKTAETTSGKWSTAVDNFKQSLADLGEYVLPTINRLLDDYNTKSETARAQWNANLVTQYGAGNPEDALEYLKKQKELKQALADRGGSFEFDLLKGGFVYTTAGQYKNQVAEIEAQIAQAEKAIQARKEYAAEEERFKNTGASKNGTAPLPAWKVDLLKLTGESELDVVLGKIGTEAERAARQAAALGMDVAKPFADAAKEVGDLYVNLDNLAALDKRGTLGPDWTGRLTGAAAAFRARANPASPSYEDIGLDWVDRRMMFGFGETGSPEAPTEPEIGLDWVDRRMMFGSGNAEEPAKKVDATAAAMERLKKSMEGITASSLVSSFEAIGESLARGADGGDSFAAAMSNIGAQAASQTGQLMTTLGLELLVANPANPAGWALLAAGGLVSIGAGAWSYANSSSSNGTSTGAEAINADLANYYLAAESFNQQGRKSAMLTGYAAGTSFAAGGWSWVGERGPELMRVPRGAQILPNHIAKGYADGLNVPGGVVVNILPPRGYTAEAVEGTDASGLRTVDVYVKKLVRSEIAKAQAGGRKVST